MNKLLRVGMYLRLSDEDSDKVFKEQTSESIKNQRNLLLEEIKRRPEFILVDEYCDEDLSGAGTYRPEFERMIRDCELGKIDIVIAKSQSRFSRDMEIIEKYLHNKFLEWNVRFIGLSDNADTNNLGNKKARQINGLVNEWYLEDVSNNIKSAFNAKMKNGEFISPFAPFGYDVSKEDNNKLIIDPVASNVVKDIFKLYLTGLGFTGVANYLNNNDIPSPSHYKYERGIKLNIVSKNLPKDIKWNANAIKTILKNEIYLGHLIQGKRTTTSYKNKKIKLKSKDTWIRYENTHKAIIDINTFNKVKLFMEIKSKPCKVNNKAHVFSGRVFCLECHHKMRKKNSSNHEYLTCYSNKECINKESIRYDVLESIILKNINNKINKYYDKDYLINKINSSLYERKINELKDIKNIIVNKMETNNKYLKHIYQDKINKVLTNDQFKSLSDDYLKEKKNCINKIKSIDKEINMYKNKINNNFELLGKNKEFKQLNNVIVSEFVDKIYIGKINKEEKTRIIKIIWNF